MNNTSSQAVLKVFSSHIPIIAPSENPSTHRSHRYSVRSTPSPKVASSFGAALPTQGYLGAGELLYFTEIQDTLMYYL